ncbi:Na+/H+ antiporter subunit E [Spirochaeta isovalerica]|uniref:Multicomponent Na+:H+ antiporter subunit E n=1 Tax=Spirochaeta isovalerica TaxID=150 RepID=A0A841RDW8_9SPIO|nr:Na+/H+ antiporter subunit E [Spirochaeta isovalerica]MBB6481417.1 multicomponent Na+:H+ antiporter subunit E [Spirochaeta isovalerica]
MSIETRWKLIRFFITALSMFGLWLIFTASFELFSLVTGLGGSFFVAALTYEIFIPRHQAGINFFVPRPFHLILYLFLMIFFIYKSSIAVLVAVVTGQVNPRIVHFRTPLKSDMARMVLANSITMTPGTITLDLNDDHLTVHWFFSTTSHSKVAGNEVKGEIERHLKKVWL